VGTTQDSITPVGLAPRPNRPFYRRPSSQIVAAIVLGIALGFVAPSIAVPMKVLGDIFLRLIQTIVAPLVFLNVVLGIVAAGDLKQVGRIGLRALIYFEVVSTIALLFSLVVANFSGVGEGMQGMPTATNEFAQTAHVTFTAFLTNVFPTNFIGTAIEGATKPSAIPSTMAATIWLLGRR
jgi:aerobic C4-dicarboxylate transport protein